MSLTIHQSGINAAINAQASGFAGVTLNRVDLYNGSSKIKALTLKGVQVIEPSRIYVVAQDSTTDVYNVTKMQFYTDGGVLFATAQNDDGSTIQSKAANATLLLAHQLNLSASPGTVAPSGDVSIYAPQATESLLGTAEIATQTETNSGTDDRRMVTPKKLKAWWNTVRSWGNITGKPSTFPPAAHSHDDRYYTEAEMNTKLAAKLSRSGGTMTGNIEFSENGEGIYWNRNTDEASIKFYNTADGDTDCRLEFHIADNGNEFFQWTARSGSNTEILMDLRPDTDNLTVKKGTVYVNNNQRVFASNYHPNADKLTTARTISLSGDATGSVSFDGSANKTLSVTVKDDSHNHTIANVDGLQTALNAGTRQATESQRGQAEIATQAEVNAGTDHQRVVTPKTLKSRLSSFFTWANLSNKPVHVVSNGSNANGFWRRWSDGTIEQWGRIARSDSLEHEWNYPIPFTTIVDGFGCSETNYSDGRIVDTGAIRSAWWSNGLNTFRFQFTTAGSGQTWSITWRAWGK